MKNRKCHEIPPENVNVQVMKKTGGFFRKGEIGDGNKNLTDEDKTKIEQWIQKHLKNERQQFEKIVQF